VKSVPFYSNTEDGLHCLQASIKIILKYFLPDKTFNWQELDKYTGFLPNGGTWATSSLLWLNNLGFEVKEISTFEIQRFLKSPNQYLIERYGKTIGEYGVKNSDMKFEQLQYQKLSDKDVQICRVPELSDIKQLLDDQYLLIAYVNSQTLNNNQGFAGHYVLIFDSTPKGFYIHDPGPPPTKNRFVSHSKFIKAWTFESENNKLLYAYKLKR